MYAIPSDEATRKIIERAHAERGAAVRAFFVAMFTRKTHETDLAAQPA